MLGDVTKRRQYDLHGKAGGADGKMDMEAVEVENVGWLGRFVAAQVAKFGIPIPTTVSLEVLGRAPLSCTAAGIILQLCFFVRLHD